MKYVKTALTAIFSVALVILGFIIGTKYAKPEINLDFGKTKVRKGGNINLAPVIDVDQQESNQKVKTKKRFRIRKRNR